MRLFLGLCALAACAQMAPVVTPRGVVNAFTQQPAPSSVAPGGILWISGLNLGPAEGAKAPGAPLPAQLGSPPTEVFIQSLSERSPHAMPLYSIATDKIVAQVPFEVPLGLANVVVHRGTARSQPARVMINRLEPALRTTGDKGYGEAAGTLAGRILTITASGLGETEPKLGSGEAGAAAPRQPIRVYVGGLPATATTTHSADRPGEFEIKIETPDGALAGDVVSVVAGNQAANRATFQSMRDVQVAYVPLPDDTPELRSISTSDLRGTWLIATGDRDDAGCWPGFVFDMAKKTAARIDDCLTAANRNAVSPIVVLNESPALAALVGPPQEGDALTGVSNKVVIFHPAKDAPVKAELPENASLLRSGGGGDVEAVVPGQPPRRFSVDIETGAVGELEAAGPGLGGGGGGLNIAAIQVDLGDNMTHLLSMPAAFPPNQIMVIVGDDADRPQQAKIAILNQRGQLQGTRDFPDGWVPLIPPRQAQAPGAGGGVNLPLPPGLDPSLLARMNPRSVMFTDQQTRNVYVLSRMGNDSRHGLVAASADGVKAMPFPDGWFAAACTPNIPLFNLEIARKVTLFGANTAETEVRNPCPAVGYLALDLTSEELTAIRLPGAGQLNVTGGSGDLNDFIFGANTDATRRNMSDTLYILDGVNLTASRVDLPAGVNNFANLQPVRELNALIGLATTRQPGDVGLVLFDLDRGEGKLFPTPDGFATVQMIGVFTTTRKLVARGVKTGNSGAQYLIYDLISGDLIIVPNPPGVAWVGPAAQQQQQPGQQLPGPQQPGQQLPGQQQRAVAAQDPNPKANVIAAICYDQDRKQVGILTVRVP
jgi:uncharacterized protein (TIGR03437 family)